MKIKNIISKSTWMTSLAVCMGTAVMAQNPLIMDQFTADPTARVFGDRIYVYPSHDIRCDETQGRPDWFCMEDYHVFSSSNLTEWEDHGKIISQQEVPWADENAYSMWAPDCIEKDGKYYFYFPTRKKEAKDNEKGFSIGVAVSDQPEGPFVPQDEPIKGVRGIDPNVLIDHDGQAYLYWSEGHIYGAKLKDNMLELASPPKILKDLPSKGLKEGPFVFEREGIYYMTYPHVENKTERLEYAIGDNPLGPFEFQGVIMDESPTGCWTNHHSLVNFQDQWYLFYHHNDLSPDFDKNRSIRADSLFFDAQGRIEKVEPTLRGIGLINAFDKIHLDRYSQISENGAAISFLDAADTFQGWKTVLKGKEAWIKYDAVDFGKGNAQRVTWRIRAPQGGTVQIRQGTKDGELISELKLGKSPEWKSITTPLIYRPSGVEDLVLKGNGSEAIEVDWIRWGNPEEEQRILSE